MDVLDYLSPSNVTRVHLRRTVMLCLLMLLSPVADSLSSRCCSFSLLLQESMVVFLSPQKPTIGQLPGNVILLQLPESLSLLFSCAN